MRRRIRLTGRRQLPRSSVDVRVTEVGEKRVVSLVIVNHDCFSRMPETARIKLRLFENKFSETLDFGTLGKPKATAEVKNSAFSVPTCQLRVVATDGEQKGLLLGSTNTWNLKAGGSDEGEQASESILLFLPQDISPRAWKLDIRDDDYPVVYIDKRIPDPRTWARNDPVFLSCVLPAIIREVFEEILQAGSPPEQAWAKDWMAWADTLMPGKPPPWNDGRPQKLSWLDDLLDSFCHRHDMLGRLVGKIEREIAA
ncbi:MAG TPA: hypothetical protein ENJ12_12015 [Thiolapillus brandeum]|uniref:Uncharacterized protein n=1 Tax=Thiolapillus brandeum TaxID=1076588 RepID=A0A831S0F1_9GAMM|nr:hypothetical protein [Thiolapillus brandeum]